jgi:mannosyltransferase
MAGRKVKQMAQRLVRVRSMLRLVPSIAWLLGALLVAAALRMPGLGQQSLWVDEGTTYVRAALPFGVVLDNLLEVHNQVPLYYLLVRLTTQQIGSSEFALRLPSVFSGLLNITVIYLLGRISGRRGVGLLAAWFAAVNPFHVWYCREARMYSLGLLLASGAMWCFLSALRRGAWRRWAGLAAVSAGAYLTHYATLGLGLIQFLILLLTFRRTHRALRRWTLAQAVAILPAVGWLALSMLTYGYSGLRGSWIPMPSPLAPAKTFWNFGLGYDGRLTLWTACALLLLAVALCAGVWHRSERLWRLGMITWLTALPSLALVLSFVLGPVYVDRYLSVCVPAYLLLLAAGVVGLPMPRLRGVLGASLLVTMAVFSLGIVRGNRLSKPNWRGAITHVIERAQPGDELLVDAKGFFVASYYVGQVLPIRRLDVGAGVVPLDTAVIEGGRLWILYRDPSESPHGLGRAKPFDPYASEDAPFAAWLEGHVDRIEQEWRLNGLYLALIEPSSAASADHRG